MRRYEQASHVSWRYQYHIVWTAKYRFRILKGNVGKEVYRCIQVYCHQMGYIVIELRPCVFSSKSPSKAINIEFNGALKVKSH